MSADLLLDIFGWAGLAAMMVAGLVKVTRIARGGRTTPLAGLAFAASLALLGAANLGHAIQHRDRTIAEIQALTTLAGSADGPAATPGDRVSAAFARGMIQRQLNSLKFGSSESLESLMALGALAMGLGLLWGHLPRRARRPQAGLKEAAS